MKEDIKVEDKDQKLEFIFTDEDIKNMVKTKKGYGDEVE